MDWETINAKNQARLKQEKEKKRKQNEEVKKKNFEDGIDEV